ncbi:hypothetical protein [Mycobacterium montefiorense]|uniref:hypothetical protein n=1 Tax=Mycobacterium montefiorense TaxID=154654 RepID=UPI0021DBF39D|nr:hypothetical protein [Mycobacterium montefiorense]MCV7427592.1 hypothetical protein [Mycobacterium montefiorense]GLE50652.1 hypothetical protein ATCCBAA256_02400 [Mycobacterium montefiorense]
MTSKLTRIGNALFGCVGDSGNNVFVELPGIEIDTRAERAPTELDPQLWGGCLMCRREYVADDYRIEDSTPNAKPLL